MKLEVDAEFVEDDYGNLDLVTNCGHTPGGVIIGEDGIMIWTIKDGRSRPFESVEAAKAELLAKLGMRIVEPELV